MKENLASPPQRPPPPVSSPPPPPPPSPPPDGWFVAIRPQSLATVIAPPSLPPPLPHQPLPPPPLPPQPPAPPITSRRRRKRAAAEAIMDTFSCLDSRRRVSLVLFNSDCQIKNVKFWFGNFIRVAPRPERGRNGGGRRP